LFLKYALYINMSYFDKICKNTLMDIDVVVTWVNSRSPQWQDVYEKTVDKPFKTTNRFTLSKDPECELAMCLKCIRENMKWVRKTFVLTIDGQIPKCLKNEIIVHHSQLGLAPVFNSHAIESALHKITEMSEHFIYLNDDIFVRRKVTPCHFFRNGIPIVRLGWHPRLLMSDKKWINLLNATARRLDLKPDVALYHVPYATTKQIMRDAEKFFGREWSSTSRCKLRHQCEQEIAPIYASLRLALKREKATKEEGTFVLQHIFVQDSNFELLRPFIFGNDIVCVSGFSGSRRELCEYLTIRNNRLLYIVVFVMLVAAIIIWRGQRFGTRQTRHLLAACSLLFLFLKNMLYI